MVFDGGYHNLTAELVVFRYLTRHTHIDNPGTKRWRGALVVWATFWNEFHTAELVNSRMHKVFGNERLAS